MPNRIRVGIVGAGEVTQVVHLPTLTFLSDKFEVTALCDVSKEAIEYSARKWNVANVFLSSTELVEQDNVDLVLIAHSDEYHASCAIEAARHGKHVFLEKPMALTHRDALQIREAAMANGVKVFVAYMRRYAPAFSEFLRLVNESGPIRHAIVKDIVGPNSFFVAQSGTEPRKFSAHVPKHAIHDKLTKENQILQEALGPTKAASARLRTVYRLLGSLGSHDISFMREALGGMPDRCLSAFASEDGMFISAQFEYTNKEKEKEKEQQKYSVLYTTGIHSVGVFESFVEVFTDKRIVRIDIDTPYVKGLPIHVSVKENDSNGIYSERVIRTSYKDAYTSEFEQLYDALTSGSDLKTTVMDAAKDLEVFDMIMAHLEA